MDPWSVPTFKNLELTLTLFATVIKLQLCVYKEEGENNFQQAQKRSDKYLAEPILDINVTEAKVKPPVLMQPFALLPENPGLFFCVCVISYRYYF